MPRHLNVAGSAAKAAHAAAPGSTSSPRKPAEGTGLARLPPSTPRWLACRRLSAQSRGEHGKAEQKADRNRELARRLRGQQAEARQAAGDQRRTASHCQGEIGNVVGGGSVGEDESVPGESLEELRAAYLTAVAAYEKVEVGYDLRLEVDRLSRAESGARSAVEKIDQKARGKAEELLLTPDGSDASARAEAEARCQRRAGSLEDDVTAAAKEAGKLEQAFRATSRRSLPGALRKAAGHPARRGLDRRGHG